MVVERLDRVDLPGSAMSVVPAGVSFLAPEEAVLEAMLAGWFAGSLRSAATTRGSGARVM